MMNVTTAATFISTESRIFRLFISQMSRRPIKGERGEHENANAAAEIAAVDGDESLRGENTGPVQFELLRVGAAKNFQPRKSPSRKNEPRHDTAEDSLGRDEKQEAADEPAGKAYRCKDWHIHAFVGRGRRETPPRGVTGRDLAWEQRDGARRVGVNWRQSGGDQRREGEKRASSGNSIDEACRESRERNEYKNHRFLNACDQTPQLSHVAEDCIKQLRLIK